MMNTNASVESNSKILIPIISEQLILVSLVFERIFTFSTLAKLFHFLHSLALSSKQVWSFFTKDFWTPV